MVSMRQALFVIPILAVASPSRSSPLHSVVYTLQSLRRLTNLLMSARDKERLSN